MMRTRSRQFLPILLLLALITLPHAQGQERGTPRGMFQRTLVFVPPSTLRVSEPTPIRVVPGDLVEMEIPPEDAAKDRKIIHDCRWEEKKKKRSGPFGIFTKEVTEERKEKVPVQLRLGQQIQIVAKVPGNDPKPLAEEKLRMVSKKPGAITFSGSADTSLPRLPHPDAKCLPIPLASGEAWYRVFVRITRFP